MARRLAHHFAEGTPQCCQHCQERQDVPGHQAGRPAEVGQRRHVDPLVHNQSLGLEQCCSHGPRSHAGGSRARRCFRSHAGGSRAPPAQKAGNEHADTRHLIQQFRCLLAGARGSRARSLLAGARGSRARSLLEQCCSGRSALPIGGAPQRRYRKADVPQGTHAFILCCFHRRGRRESLPTSRGLLSTWTEADDLDATSAR